MQVNERNTGEKKMLERRKTYKKKIKEPGSRAKEKVYFMSMAKGQGTKE